MDEQPYNFQSLVAIVTCLLVVFGLYIMVSAIITTQTTGILIVRTPKPDAIISVSQANKQAVIIGTGSTKVRLAAGTYQVAAVNAGFRTVTIVKVSSKHSVLTSLNLNKTSVIRSPANINFQNMSALVNQGISSNQASELQQYFFQYKPSTNRVAIDASSVQAGPPDLSVPTFTLNFNVTIDSVPYKATATYSDSNNVRLYLYNSQDSTQVFDSGPPSRQEGNE